MGKIKLRFNVGDRVEGGDPGEDFDTGKIQEIGQAVKMAFVAWDSGVSTWTPVVDLRREMEERQAESNDMFDFVVCESADGYSIHAPGSPDEAIAEGSAPPLADGLWTDDEHIIPAGAYDEARRALSLTDRAN